MIAAPAPPAAPESWYPTMPKPKRAPDDTPRAASVLLALTTTPDGIALDIQVLVAGGAPGLDRRLGEAMREPGMAAARVLADALGTPFLDPQPDDWRGQRVPTTIAAARQGRS